VITVVGEKTASTQREARRGSYNRCGLGIMVILLNVLLLFTTSTRKKDLPSFSLVAYQTFEEAELCIAA
jgi:hypothetical protein